METPMIPEITMSGLEPLAEVLMDVQPADADADAVSTGTSIYNEKK
jgi:hypothetical protein